MKPDVVPRYFITPSRMWPDVKAPYGFNCASQFLQTYLGSGFGDTEKHLGLEIVLRSELAFWVSLQLLCEACAGQLWWILYELRLDIRKLGLTSRTNKKNYSDSERDSSQKLATFLNCIASVSWQDLPTDGIIPEWRTVPWRYMGGPRPRRIGTLTPVFKTQTGCISTQSVGIGPIRTLSCHRQRHRQRRDRASSKASRLRWNDPCYARRGNGCCQGCLALRAVRESPGPNC